MLSACGGSPIRSRRSAERTRSRHLIHEVIEVSLGDQIGVEAVDEEEPAQCARPDSSARSRRLPHGSPLSGQYRAEGYSLAFAPAIQPCGHASTVFHATSGPSGLASQRGADRAVAWGKWPVFRLRGIDTVEVVFTNRGGCPPSTPGARCITGWPRRVTWAKPVCRANAKRSLLSPERAAL